MNPTKTILRLAAATPLVGAASADLIITGVIDVYSSPNFGAPWTLEATEQVTVPAPADKYFYRLNAEQP